MTFLVVLCEGETEMDFVRLVLSAHFAAMGVTIHQILLGKKVTHDVARFPGGVFRYEPVYRHIMASLRQHSAHTSFVTTLIDLYAFPQDFPNYAKHDSLLGRHRAESLEKAVQSQVNDKRFVPHLQLHEFEALVLADPDQILNEFGDDKPAEAVKALLREIHGRAPEDVDDTPSGAPSHRICRHVQGYRKRRMGPAIVSRIGLGNLRTVCPHFGAWLTRLEELASNK